MNDNMDINNDNRNNNNKNNNHAEHTMIRATTRDVGNNNNNKSYSSHHNSTDNPSADRQEQQQQMEQQIEQQRRPEHIYYQVINEYFQNSIQNGYEYLYDIKLFHHEIHRLWELYHIPQSSLISFLRSKYLIHIKKVTYKIKKDLPRIINLMYQHQSQQSQQSQEQQPKNGFTIKQLAKQMNYSPYLLARMIIQEITTITNTKDITMCLRDPFLKLNHISILKVEYQLYEKQYQQQQIQMQSRQQKERIQLEDCIDADGNDRKRIHSSTEKSTTNMTKSKPITTRLAFEVQEALDADPMYGPKYDKISHMVGIEFEVVLEYKLKCYGVPFETEAELRHRGTARTPDILLCTPLGIQVPSTSTEINNNNNNNKECSSSSNHHFEWKTIAWIDSKALFGDVHTHTTKVLPQAESYVHRFGPGLIIYWFGHAPLDQLRSSNHHHHDPKMDGNGKNNNNHNNDIFVMGWDIPEQFMLPTGKILSAKKEEQNDKII